MLWIWCWFFLGGWRMVWTTLSGATGQSIYLDERAWQAQPGELGRAFRVGEDSMCRYQTLTQWFFCQGHSLCLSASLGVLSPYPPRPGRAAHLGPLSWDAHQPVLVSFNFAHNSVNVLSLNSLQTPFCGCQLFPTRTQTYMRPTALIHLLNHGKKRRQVQGLHRHPLQARCFASVISFILRQQVCVTCHRSF